MLSWSIDRFDFDLFEVSGSIKTNQMKIMKIKS